MVHSLFATGTSAILCNILNEAMICRQIRGIQKVLTQKRLLFKNKVLIVHQLEIQV